MTAPNPPRLLLLKTQRLLAILLLIAQAGITVTGSIVRVTGSGLGCPTWPTCHEGSLVPVAGAAPAIHQAIEFGNRLLTFVLVALALALFLSVFFAKRRKEVVNHAFIQGLGIIVQAVIGGLSVLLDLQWWAVALHFLPSMLLVWLAAILVVRVSEPDEGAVIPLYPAPLRWLAAGSGAALAVVLATGTMVTGAGPHSGDEGVGMDGRLQVDIAEIAHLHAHSMYLYLGLTIGLVVALITVAADKRALRIGLLLIGFIVVQAAIGIIQYNWGVPRWTVPVHVGLSGVVCAFTGMLYARHQTRTPMDTLTGSPAGDARIKAPSV
ncbi:heme A synthase [Corynebacterium sp.]|uniref:COX15/CtaA family protein n=1 Tax=Corynebacterium sp. TaxID=1720 RepID=UPI0026DBF309|nr:COX15/CtaA family protein [Corynebacterium sp.]MDO5077464.1 COX15/CtaA family protein [Corynebacterium sp.]